MYTITDFYLDYTKNSHDSIMKIFKWTKDLKTLHLKRCLNAYST